MARALRTFASLVLLAVLSGAPVAAVICAELCAPEHHAVVLDHPAHHTPAAEPQARAVASSDAGGVDCHGKPVHDGQSLQSERGSRCADASAVTTASLSAGRFDFPQLVALGPDSLVASRAPAPLDRRRHLGHEDVRPPRPVSASPVLRI